jgi:hypothetical protein
VRPQPAGAAAADALHAEILKAGPSRERISEVLARHAPEDSVLMSVLRRPLPVPFLEHVGTTPPWSERGSVLGKLVLNPKTPRALSLRLLPSVYWRDLADVAAGPNVPAAVRVHSEAILLDALRDLRLGERVTLAKIATPRVLRQLLSDAESKVSRAALINPRLREEDLLVALRKPEVPAALIEATVSSPRWSECYGVRLALALQPRTPLPLALLQISSLTRQDLLRVAETPSLRPLIQAAALRVAETLLPSRGGRTLRGSAT